MVRSIRTICIIKYDRISNRNEIFEIETESYYFSLNTLEYIT